MATSSATVKNIFQDYAPPIGAYDEFFSIPNRSRVHTQFFVESLMGIGQDELALRWDQTQHLVHENGLAYGGNVIQKDKPRPWELDAIPLLISGAEWQPVSSALEQRANVLNLVLQDLYGEQKLLKEGILPAELVFSHPGFLRSYHGQPLPLNRFLHFYSADLARSPDGKWWVVADRTEAPSGLGYALENRVAISGMYPDLFHQCQVQRLAPFFIAARETLRSLAPRNRENPRVVLLSYGPTGKNYFEDAYLARYLGYTLVEGGDLTVRNNQVMLKTLGGLLPVDVIMRRQNSGDCDSLELDPTSRFGIAGLTQAARMGNVGIANPLGSGLVESVAFMEFMPALCQALLGEDLVMPGVATWWCGRPQGLNRVLSNLDQLTIYPAYRRRGYDGPSRELLGEMSLDALAKTIKSDPGAYAAQEKVTRSCAPTWSGRMRPAHLALRAYVVGKENSYMVMQGALARISSSLDPLELSIRRGEGSKDAWILSNGPVENVSLLKESGQVVTLRRRGAELPSRAADNIFWLGRQLERAEAAARLLRSTASRLIGETRSTSDVELPLLLRCLADQGQIEPDYAINDMNTQLPPIDHVLPTSVFDSTNGSCLRSVLDNLFRLGAIVHDRMSEDTWRIIRRIDEEFRQPARGTTNIADLLTMSNKLIVQLAAFSGIIMESMTRTQAFRFLDLGRRLERSLQIISLIRNFFIPLPTVHGPIFETALEVADSLMTYRSRYLANFQLASVLDLLLTDESNPRSLAFQFVRLAEHVEQLPRDQSQPGYTVEQRYAMSLLHSIRMLDVQPLAETHNLGEYQDLETLLATWEKQMPQLSESISHRYLVHAVPAHQLSEIRPR